MSSKESRSPLATCDVKEDEKAETQKQGERGLPALFGLKLVAELRD
jgi:hypothetical protein